MPDESPTCEERKSFILVRQQTQVRFNAILVETCLNADDQLHQFFQIYQCIKTTLTVCSPKRKLNNIDNFLSQLEEFKRYVLAFTKQHTDPVTSSVQSTHRRTRSQAKKRLSHTDIQIQSPPEPPHLDIDQDDDSCNADANTDGGYFKIPKEDECISASLTLDNEPQDNTFDNITEKVDAKSEQSISETLTSHGMVKNTDKCNENNESRLDKKSKKPKRKRKVSKELSTDNVSQKLTANLTIKVENIQASPASENDEISEQSPSAVKKRVKIKNKKIARVKRDRSAASNQVVQKVLCKMKNGKYVCEHCSYNTTRKYNMDRHIFKHSDQPICRICNVKVVDSTHLKSHMVLSHGQAGDSKACCSLCGENFLSLNSLRKHKQFVHLKKAKYHCKTCEIFFDSRSRFDAHMSKHTGVAPYHCVKCGKGYRFKKNLIHHAVVCTGKSVPYEKKDGRLHCKECRYSTRWYTDIKRHGYQHNPQDKHACSRCDKSYCSILELHEHVNTAHLDLKFLCYGCGKKFNSRRALNRHANHAHENIYKYTCEVCEKRFYDKVKFDDHKDKHTGAKNHVCHVCGLAYRYKPRFITHLKMHTNLEQFSCNICAQKFNVLATLKNHMIGKHSVDRYYRCPWCSKEFRWSSSLSFHKRKTSNYTKVLGKYRCSLCSYCTTRKYDINTHCQKHKQRTYTCKHCVITFETRQGLQRHLNLNHKQQAFAFPCPVCSNVYGYKSELEEHMLEHPGNWLHHCPKCSKGFSKQEYLTQHLKRCGRQRFTENNEYGKEGKVFYCKLCNYKTEWSTSIKRHRFTHTVVGKPTCEICSKSYCCEGDLRDHMNVAHANAKFLCYQCGKEFSCRSSLLRHTQVTHELKYKYKCDVCSQQFTDKRKMADHMDKHTGVRNHICHICGMAYRYRPRLAVHLRRHQNPEPLQCEYCKKTFKNSDTLRVHVMGKHLDRKYPCPYCGKDFIWHKSMSHHKKRCRSRPLDLSNEDVELDVDVPQLQVERRSEDEILDEQMATDMVIQAAAEAIKAEPPINNPWKVYRIPTYSSNPQGEITVSNISGLPISNLSSIPISHLTNLSVPSINTTSMSNFVNLSDVSGSGLTNLTVPGLSSLPVATFSNLPVSTISELPMAGISNGQASTASNLTISTMANLSVSTMSNESITTLSNVPVSSLTNVPLHISSLSNVPVSNMSNMHMTLPLPSLHSVVTQALSSEWKVDSTQIPVYAKNY